MLNVDSIDSLQPKMSGLLSWRWMTKSAAVEEFKTEGMIEREFIQQVFGYVGEKYRFRVFQNQCSDAATALRAHPVNVDAAAGMKPS